MTSAVPTSARSRRRPSTALATGGGCAAGDVHQMDAIGDESVSTDPDTSDDQTMPELTVHKATGYLPVSVEMLLDAGVITEEQARAQGWIPPPPTPRRIRLRWWWWKLRERIGRRVGSWIAGVDLSESECDE